MLGYRRGKAREGRVGGFPEPEPKGVARKSPISAQVRKVLPVRKNLRRGASIGR